MRQYKENFESLVRCEFIQRKLYKTPITLMGTPKKIIKESIWTDFLVKFRHFILRKDGHTYEQLREIAFRTPRGDPRNENLIEVTKLIEHQERVANDAYENGGMFTIETAIGETYSPYKLWEAYAYSYVYHVKSKKKRLPALADFNLVPENPIARAHFASCLMIKITAFQRLYAHITDLLSSIDQPDLPASERKFASRPYPTQSYLEEKRTKQMRHKDYHGYGLLAPNNYGPFKSFGPCSFSIETTQLSVMERSYSQGFHVLTDETNDIQSVVLILTPGDEEGVKMAKTMLRSSPHIFVRGNEFSFHAKTLKRLRSKKPEEFRIEIDRDIHFVVGEMLGPASSEMYSRKE